jgi:stage V sporulation protein B
MRKGLIYIMLGQSVFMLSGYILHISIGRSLGPELYGIFGILTAFLFMLERLLFGSISKGITKFIVENKKASRTIINHAIKIQSFFSLVIFFVFYILAGQIAMLMGDLSLTEYFQILTFLIMISGFYIIYLAALNGIEAFDKQAIIWVAYSVARILLVVLLIKAGYSLKGIVLGLLFAGILCLLISQYYCKPLMGRGTFDKKGLISYSSKVLAFTFATLLIMNIDLISIKIILKDALATGFYTAALNLARIPTLIAFPLSIVLFPLITKSVSDNDTERAIDYINNTLRYLLLFLVPFAIIINATSHDLIILIYGSVYSAATSGLSILVFGMTFITISIVMNTIILAVCKLSWIILFNFLLVFLDVILNFILINKYGMIGAAIATTIIGLVGSTLSLYYVFRNFSFTIRWTFFINIIVSSVIIYFIARSYPFSGMLLLPSYLVLYAIYFAILFLFKEINSQDIRMLKGAPLVRHAIGKDILVE